MGIFSRSHRASTKRGLSAKLQLEILESRDLLSTDVAAAALALVPNTAVTAQAVQSGNWSSPATWHNGLLPAANANVLIPAQVSVTIDGTTPAIHSLRIDGTLQFATNVDTNLLVDTLVVNMTGSLVIGTAANPISPLHHATVTFTANGPINTVWDPNSLSRGLIALGAVTMYGAATTPYVTLAHDVTPGATTLTLAQVPTNWNVGDEIVLGGTYSKWNQDEDLHILSIQGNQVTVSPLTYSHTSSNGVPVYLADVTRNIVLRSQDQNTVSNHGYVMFMCAHMTSIHYAEFLGLDRTDKSLPINDPHLDSTGRLVAGTGTNPRDRYAVTFWADLSTTPGVVDGSTVVGSPGWGFVNHSSNANFTNDVAFNVNGASFVSEAGDELGSFDHDLAIHSLGTGDEVFYNPVRVPLQDWGHEGDGFWMQGNGVTVTNNIALGQAAAGYYYFSKPFTLPVQNVNPSTAPLTGFHNNLAESCDYGAFLRYETNGGTIDGLTVHDSTTGYEQEYSTGITLQNSHLYGTMFSDYGIFLPVESAQGFVASNNLISGWPVGIRFSEQYNQALTGGTFSNNQYDIEIPDTIQAGRRITIFNPTFNPSTDPTHLQVCWLQEFFAVFTRSLNAFFVPDNVFYNGVQLYAPWQNANYVPFPQQPSGLPPLPAALIGKTNLQLYSLYGLAMGGFFAPPPLNVGLITNGTAGASANFPPAITLISPGQTSQLTGYQLQFMVGNGPVVSVPTLFNLVPGWNMLNVSIGGFPMAFFVFGAPYIPTNLLQAASSLTHSYEYYADFIMSAYHRYLGRVPDLAGLSGWVGAMQHGLSDEGLEASLLSSAEFIANHGGLGRTWVISLYQTLLRRTPSASEVTIWVNALAGGMAPINVAYGFAASRERETNRVANDYITYLGRTATQAEIAGWVNLFMQGYSNENLVAGFVGSAEYYLSANRGNSTDAGWVTSAYQDLFYRTPTLDELNNWSGYLC
jgi:hypothetical protein